MRRDPSTADFELIRLVAVGAAMMVVTVLVIGRSTAAFSDDAAGAAGGGVGSGFAGVTPGDEPTSDFGTNAAGVDADEAGNADRPRPTIELTDNDSGRAVIDVGAMVPQQREVRCVQVSYEGAPGADPVRLYSASGASGTGLGGYLELTVESGAWTGSTSAYPSCDGFEQREVLLEATRLDQALSEHDSYETGITTWTPDPIDAQVFRFTFELIDDNDAQGRDVRFDLIWESRS